ncbi:hypothetical protein RR48_12004 [Papilio machaon]|uniref:Uncharacterized protein n=1 Tax=Papilio machaon TaxID=76193 RepID=A0A194RQ58_PAPMA|nr:hypothetical protein RR48_12004 [Papilio machaon]
MQKHTYTPTISWSLKPPIAEGESNETRITLANQRAHELLK